MLKGTWVSKGDVSAWRDFWLSQQEKRLWVYMMKMG